MSQGFYQYVKRIWKNGAGNSWTLCTFQGTLKWTIHHLGPAVIKQGFEDFHGYKVGIIAQPIGKIRTVSPFLASQDLLFFCIGRYRILW